MTECPCELSQGRAAPSNVLTTCMRAGQFQSVGEGTPVDIPADDQLRKRDMAAHQES
jgi:hypothetical protein